MAEKTSQQKILDQRSRDLNPNNEAFKKALDNKSVLMNTEQGTQNDPKPTDNDDYGDYGAWESADA